MKVVGRLTTAVLGLLSMCCCLQSPTSAQDVHSMSLGQIEIRLVSTAVSETNSLLKILLSTTAHFLDASFLEVDQVAFRKVACSILDYRLGSVKRPLLNSNTFYEANVTLTGYAYFVGDTTITQRDLIDLSIDAFEAENSMFLRSLLGSANPFLSNLEHAVVRVNGDKVVEQTGSDDADKSGALSFLDFLPFPMWVVAVVAGGMAFLLVLCFAFACFCCCGNKNESVVVIQKNSSSGTNTKRTGGSSYDDDERNLMLDARSKTPSPTRSIASQDSSVFTYNPKTSRTVGSYFSSSNFSYDAGAVDDAEASAQFYYQGPGTILAPSKDLSLIEEGSEVSSEQSTPRQLRQQLEHQNFKSLLKRPESYDEDDDEAGGFHSLTADALREIEWNAAKDVGAITHRNSRWDIAAARKQTTAQDDDGACFDVYGDSVYGSPLKQQRGLLETVDFAATDLETQMENLYGEKF